MSADHGDTAVPGRHTADGETAAAPRFDVVVRGYDRRQVDEHIAGLERTISRQRTDLEQARESGARSGAGTNGTSGPKADERSRAGAAALFGTGGRPGGGSGADSSGGLTPEMISAFTTRLQSILQAAEEEAEEVRTNARNYARKEEDAGRARLAELERRRETTLADLARVRSQLEGVLDSAKKESPIGANLPPGTPPPTPPQGLPLRGDKAPGGPARMDPNKRAEQTGPRMGPLSVGADGNRQRPPSPGHQPVGPDGGQGRPLPNRQAPGQGARPPGSAPQGSPVHQSGAQNAPSPKPRPTPSPRPRANPPAPDGAGVSGGAPQGTREASGRGPAEQHARNGVINRENGAPPGRGDDPDGRPSFGGGAR